ncbi:site-specific integrase [Pendulispora brunnea]|uniref:Site-specific integrase n=1 Tax=Pendulispora brunnea TaxID=2905690 RepID=A0ABZ2KDM6_9BACT
MAGRLARVTDPHALLTARAFAYVEEAKASSTRRAYRTAWGAFEAWCAAQEFAALPADPSTVALYIAYLADEGLAVSTIGKVLAAIADAHRTRGLAWLRGAPAVNLTMSGIRRKLGVAPHQKTPVRDRELRAMVATLEPADGQAWSLTALRDRALLTLGWSGMFRRSELVSLGVRDIRRVREGLIVTLRRSKTDQTGKGREKGIPYAADPDLCPVRALEAWLVAAKITEGPIFRAVNRHGQVSKRALSDRSVADIVKRVARAAGLDDGDYSGHSVRAGAASTAAENGRSLSAIMKVGGWTSERVVVERYIRHANLFVDHATKGLI